MKKIISLTIVLFIFINLLSINVLSLDKDSASIDLLNVFQEQYSSSLLQETEGQEKVETKVYCEATIDDNFMEDEIIVVLTREQSALQQEYTTDDFEGIPVSQIKVLYDYYPEDNNHMILSLILDSNNKQNVLDSISILENDERIISAEPNFEIEANIIDTDSYNLVEDTVSVLSSESVSYLSDELSSNTKINFCCAKKYTESNKNSPVKIGIVDRGIYDNIEALNYIPSQPEKYKVKGYVDCRYYRELDDDNPDTVEEDTYIKQYYPPYDYHGTNIALVIAKNDESTYEACPTCGNNLYSGICNNVELYSIFALYGHIDSEYVGYMINAFNYAKKIGIDVLNISAEFAYRQTSTNYNPAFDKWCHAWETAIDDYPGLIVTAAGNFEENLDNINGEKYPVTSEADNVIVVGSCYYVNSVGQMWKENYSAYGLNTVDLFAPGMIYGYDDYGNRKTCNATSYAAPRVAAAAAVLWSINENLTPAQIKDYIMKGVDSSSNLAGKCVSGGSLNIYKSAKMVIADMAYDGKSIFTGHFTRTDKIQVAAITRGAYNASKIYVWTYDTETGTFSDPEHLKTNFSYALDNDWGRNKFRIVCGDFDGNGYDEFCTLYDYDDYLFIEGKDYICHPGDIPVPVEGFTGKVAALDYDNDGRDEVVGFYGISEGVTDLYVWDFNGSGASMTASLTYQYRIPIYFNAQNIDYKVVSGNFDSDAREEVAAIYRSSVSIYHYYLIMINFTENGIAYTEPLSVENTFDVNTFWGRIVTCNYDGAGPDEIVFLYNNPNASPNGIINYGVILNTVSGAWSVNPLYESGANEFNADISTDLMSAGDYNGDGYDEVLAFYKLPAATPANVRTRIYLSQHEIRNGEHKLTGYFCKWDPRGQY